MRIQNYNMQKVPSAGKRGYPSHSWFKYRAKWQEEKKNLFLYILLCCPTEHEHKLTSWEHQEFSGSLPTGPMFSQVLDNLCHELWCFLALHGIHQPLKTNKKNISFFSLVIAISSETVRNRSVNSDKNRDFSRGWAKQLSLPNHYNTSLETLINWKWGEFYRNDSPIKQTNKMTNH